MAEEPKRGAGSEGGRADRDWQRELTPDRYKVLRGHATEPPGSSPLNGEHRAGTFRCAGCGETLFSSDAKFDSGSGWPSFVAPAGPGAVATSVDRQLRVPRTEIHCARCGGHLGHVFEDGPRPTGQRYCVNGLSLVFEPVKDSD